MDVSSFDHQFQLFLNKYKYNLDDNTMLLVYKYNLLSETQLKVIKDLMEIERISKEQQELSALKEKQDLITVALVFLAGHVALCVAAVLFSYYSKKDDFDFSDGSVHFYFHEDHFSSSSEYSYSFTSSSVNSLESLESYHSDSS